MGKLKFKEKNKVKQKIDGVWNILVVDDDEGIHKVTQKVLEEIVFDNKKLNLISAYSAKEAIDILSEKQDIAVVFLDVVMESDEAGLKAIKLIRENLNNKLIRIILRTGQPGIAPQKDIISNYEINDYVEKTELTDIKLYTITLSALRNYRDLINIKEKQELLIKQSRFAAMGEIMDAVAHQWKQPLSTINVLLTGIEFEQEIGSLDDEKINNCIENSKKQINHLVETINEFRKMIKGEVTKECISLYNEIQEVLLLLKDSIEKYNIEFIFDGNKDKIINTASTEFRHILINLINNAKDEFIRRDIKNKKIIFKWYDEDNFTILKVLDNAGGIDNNIINKIFDLHFTTKEKTGGSGMGLYMSKLFAQKLDIKINVLNENNGACFILKIPNRDKNEFKRI